MLWPGLYENEFARSFLLIQHQSMNKVLIRGQIGELRLAVIVLIDVESDSWCQIHFCSTLALTR